MSIECLKTLLLLHFDESDFVEFPKISPKILCISDVYQSQERLKEEMGEKKGMAL